MADAPQSEQAREILRLLRDHHLVVLTGPPSTGKTWLAHQVMAAFRNPPGKPLHDHYAEIPIPDQHEVSADALPYLPSPERGDRETFEIAFSPTTKPRDVLREVMTVPGGAAGTTKVSAGKLYEANEHALTPNGASLLFIDEISRGPASTLLGPAMSALEADKRLGPDNSKLTTTSTFPLLADDGSLMDYSFSHHLYVLAARNNADTSVEGFDLALLRRWQEVEVELAPAALLEQFGLKELDGELPESPTSADDVYRAAIRAWQAVNRNIKVGRSPDFQIGHGVLMYGEPSKDSFADALEYVWPAWRRIRTHVNETFYNNPEGIAAALNVYGNADHPISIETESFGTATATVLNEPKITSAIELYSLLRAVVGP